jgi:hypothetical protein
MINIEFPLFKIPNANKNDFKKPGWWSEPKFFWEKKQFEEMKRQRIWEVDFMLNITQRTSAFNEKLDGKTFFEMKFHPKALAKSAQPKKLLDSYNIDVYAHKKEGTFFASSTVKNLTEFRNGISTLSLQDSKNESALLSAITEIKPIDKSEIWIIDSADQKVFIYLHDTISESEWKSIFEDAVKEYNLSKENVEYFVSNSNAKILYWVFPSSFLDEISKPVRWPAQKIEEVYDLQVSKSEVTSYDFTGVQIEEPLLNAFVVVVDSWIEAHDFLKKLIVEKNDYVKDEWKADRYHGTMVWSRILFWNTILDDLQKNGKLTAQAKLIDLQVLRKETPLWDCVVNPKDLVDALKEVIQKNHEKHKVYNLSLNFGHPSDPDWWKDFLTKELDALSHKYNVLFVVSAGNQKQYQTIKYPECLDESEARIATPADGINVLSVWSIADNESWKSLTKDSEPSPFTRTWFPNSKKPDVVHYWWNLDRNWRANWLWVLGFGNDKDKVMEDVGTSFSAPLVSQIASKIYAYLQNTDFGVNPPVELVKALIIHSANYSLPNESIVNPWFLNQYVWHWIPDFMRAINSLKNSATFVYTGNMGEVVYNTDKEQVINKHKILLDVPKELEWKNKKVRIKWTLVYFCPISSSGEYDYAMSDISLNISYLNGKGTKTTGNLTQSDKDYRPSWSPIKTFEKTYSAYQWGQREILLQSLVRWDLDPKDFQQSYALIISVEDVSEWDQIELHELIKTKYQQYVPLVQEIKVAQKIK